MASACSTAGTARRAASGSVTATYGQPGVRLADPEHVAELIVHGIERGRTTIYAPGMWRWIMLVIRHIPERIFMKLSI